MSYPEIKGKLGFGCMRLPTIKGNVNHEELIHMVDCFMKSGNNYFDTAHGYVQGQSEIAVKRALVDRYDRRQYVLANKLTESYFSSESDIEPLFLAQLSACGVDYFDFYMFHALTKDYYAKYTDCNAFEVIKNFRKQGKISHIGMSFHDSPDVLETILEKHPEIEVVQLQFNYLDYDNPAVQSYDNYLIARKYNKKIFVMEPIKGGSLLRLPEEALTFFTKKDYNDLANIALRFVCSFDGIDLILSGMSNTDMVINNAKCLEEHRPLSDQEFEITNKVREIINSKNAIQCTSCHYCTEGCPMNIYIPELIAAYNSKVLFKGWNSKLYYESLIKKGGKPSDCIKCGLCEKRCPQHLKIRNIITNISQSFEKKKKNPVNRIPIS